MPFSDPIKRRANAALWRERNREVITEKMRAWRRNNPDKVQAAQERRNQARRKTPLPDMILA